MAHPITIQMPEIRIEGILKTIELPGNQMGQSFVSSKPDLSEHTLAWKQRGE